MLTKILIIILIWLVINAIGMALSGDIFEGSEILIGFIIFSPIFLYRLYYCSYWRKQRILSLPDWQVQVNYKKSGAKETHKCHAKNEKQAIKKGRAYFETLYYNPELFDFNTISATQIGNFK